MVVVFATHESLQTYGVLEFEDWCLVVKRVTQVLGVHILLTRREGNLEEYLRGAYRTVIPIVMVCILRTWRRHVGSVIEEVADGCALIKLKAAEEVQSP